VAQKRKPLPSDQKSYLIILKPINEIRFNHIVTLKYESITLFVRYSMRELLSDLNTMPDPQTIDMRQIR